MSAQRLVQASKEAINKLGLNAESAGKEQRAPVSVASPGDSGETNEPRRLTIMEQVRPPITKGLRRQTSNGDYVGTFTDDIFDMISRKYKRLREERSNNK